MPLARWSRAAEDAARHLIKSHTTDPTAELYGLELAQTLRYGVGTMYPVLRRLEAAGWLLTRAEEHGELRGKGRPPRIYYRINPAGLPELQQSLADLDARRPGARPVPEQQEERQVVTNR